MSMIVSIAAALLFAQAAPAASEVTAAQPTPAAAPSTPPIKGRVRKDGKICRAEPVLGSRMPVTLCATAEEWEARRTSDKESLDRIQHGVRNPNT
jgi:hypothetical protein